MAATATGSPKISAHAEKVLFELRTSDLRSYRELISAKNSPLPQGRTGCSQPRRLTHELRLNSRRGHRAVELDPETDDAEAMRGRGLQLKKSLGCVGRKA
jgi:hypothetical protein